MREEHSIININGDFKSLDVDLTNEFGEKVHELGEIWR